MKKLYKIDSKGKLRQWTIEAIENTLVQEAGLVEGKKVSNSKVCTPKNVGKSNETTGAQQALLELKSEYKSKLDENYFPTIEEAQSGGIPVLPMLAKEYKKEAKKVDWKNAFAQPKLDGMRCLAIIKDGVVTLKSRDGKVILNMQHIENELSTIKENIILDGELYVHGENFQTNMKYIKKYREGFTEKIIFNVYDIVDKRPFSLRIVDAHKFIQGMKYCVHLHTYPIFSYDALVNWHKEFIKQGYEGTILRHGMTGYEIDKRSSSLLKYKDFIDITLPIKDIVPAEQRPLWGKPIFELNGKEFSSGMRYSHEEREDFLKNKEEYIGKTAEIRFFEYSEEGIPRFAIMHGIRLDK